MIFDPVARVEAYHAAINRLDFDGIAAFFHEDAVYLSVGTGDTVGRRAIMAAFRDYFASYPDQYAWDDLVEAIGPREARSRWNIKASHAKTGEPLSRRGLETITFDGDGCIVKVLVEDI